MQQTSFLHGPWTRSSSGVLAGVCEGLGSRMGLEPTMLRILFLASLLFGGAGLVLYAVLWWLIPTESQRVIEPTIWTTDGQGRRVPPFARTQADRKVLGVCGGLARRWQVDSAIVRLGALTLVALSAGVALVAYFVLAIVMPGQHDQRDPHPIEF